MKQNLMQTIFGFLLKYIWLFCALLIALEAISVAYTAGILTQQSSLGVMQSVSGEVSGRVDGVLRLLMGMTNDSRFSDTSQPLFDRIIEAKSYQESYGLYMVALTDEEFNVVSADEIVPPKTFPNLAHRDYMQRLYSTGEYQITDVFPAGADNLTMNYTIAAPIFNNGKVEGSVFGSIYFNDIEDILLRHSQNSRQNFYMFGENNTVMSGGGEELYGKPFLELATGKYFGGHSAKTMDSLMREGKPGSCWKWDGDGLTYVSYQRVLPTNWTIVYRVQFMSVFINLLPILLVKIFFYALMCASIYFLGRRYFTRHLSQVNHLIDRMAVIQKELFQSEQPDYENLLELTQQGLTDQLTGLSTRAVLFKKMIQFTRAPNSYGAVVFIDLDDLKRINDNFGHDGGDCALLHFAKILKEFEQKYNGLASRYGGDEFILIFNALGEKEACEISQELCKALNTTILTKENTFPIHGSLGISFYPEHGTKPEDLICKADLALYTAKQEGKNQCAFYTSKGSIL